MCPNGNGDERRHVISMQGRLVTDDAGQMHFLVACSDGVLRAVPVERVAPGGPLRPKPPEAVRDEHGNVTMKMPCMEVRQTAHQPGTAASIIPGGRD